MHTFVETHRGRELIFQNYSYTRFCRSNIYNCTSKKPQLCYAQVMLDNDKVLIISSYHNHLPPCQLRDENGAIVASYTVQAGPKPKKRGKPTLGPRATRNQVDSLVASIMNSVKAMENKNEVAKPNISEVSENEVAVSVSNELTPKMVVKRTIVPIAKKKISLENKQTISAVTSTKKNEPLDKQIGSSHVNSLLKVASTNKNEPPQDKNTADLSQKPPSQETVAPRRIGNVPFLKQDAGSLVPNQIYIVLPNVESGVQHNRFILSPPNARGLVCNNKILVSPIQTDSSTSNNPKTQEVNMSNFPTTDDIVSKKIDTNTGVRNKTFFLIQTNNMNPMTPRVNENTSLVSTNNEPATNDTGVLAPNKTVILVHNKSENDSLVSSNTQPKEHVNVPEPNDKLNTPQKEMKTANVSSNMPKPQQKKLEMKTSIPMASIKNVIFPHLKVEGIATASKINDAPSKTNDDLAAGSTLISKKPDQPMTNIIQTAFEASDMSVPRMTKTNDMNTVLPKKLKTICLLHSRCTSKAQTLNVEPEKYIKITPENNELDSSLNRDTQILTKNIGTSTAASNKMLPFVIKTENDDDKLYDSEPLVQLKAETFSAAIDNIIPKATNLVEIQKTNLDEIVPKYTETEHMLLNNKKQKTQNKTEAESLVSTVHSTVQPHNKIKKDNVCSNLPKENTITFMKSYMTALEENSKNISTTVEANISKKSASVQQVPAKKNKSDNAVTSKEKPIGSKITTIDDENGNIQLMPDKLENVDSFASKKFSNIDLDGIPPKNKKQKKIETDVLSNKNTKETDITTSAITSNIPEILIPVSMIPLPKENHCAQTDTMSKASESLVSKGAHPVVMIERLPMKHKAGSSNMRNVPLKKRYYQF